MEQEQKVFKNTFILMMGTFLPRILNLLTTPLITRYVETEGIGIISFITITILTFIIPICTLQLEQSFFRFLIEAEKEEEKIEIISSGFMTLFMIIIIVSIGTYFIPIDGFTGKYKLLLIVYIAIEMVAQILRFILRAFSMYKQYSLFAIIAVIVNIITVCICLVVFKLGYLGIFISLLIADIVSVVYVLCTSHVLSYIKVSKCHFARAKQMIYYALPFIPNMIAYSTNTTADRIIIKGFLGNGANGIYDTANKIPNIVSILYPAFNLAWSESALSNAKDKNRSKYYSQMFHMIFKILSGGTALLMAVSPYLFHILVSQKEKYGEALEYIPLLVLAMYFLCFAQFFSSIYVAENRSKNMSVTTCIAAVINIVVNLLLIHYIGLQAAIISTFISNLTLALYRYYNINKTFYRMRVNKRLFVLTVILFMLQCMLFWSYHPILQILNIILAVGFAYFICGDSVKKIVESVFFQIRQGSNHK